jgi:hypothetical protein
MASAWERGWAAWARLFVLFWAVYVGAAAIRLFPLLTWDIVARMAGQIAWPMLALLVALLAGPRLLAILEHRTILLYNLRIEGAAVQGQERREDAASGLDAALPRQEEER